MIQFVIIFSAFALIPDAKAACPSGYTMKTSSPGCFKAYSGSKVTYSEASAQCRADGAHLAEIRDANDNNFLASQFTSGSFWIGLKRETLSHPIWRYAFDGSVVQNQGCYRYDSGNSDFQYFGTVYANISYRVCVDQCRSTNPGYRYAAVTWNTNGFRCGCAMEGFRDIQFDSANKERYENGCDKPCPDSGSTTQYCGGYRFSTILSIGGTGFDQWAAGQTNNYDGYQTCASLVTEHNPDKLGDEGCHRQFSYICHDANFNFRIHETQVTWFEARNRCRRDYPGGDLAKLRTPEDRDNLGSLTSANYWIGLTNTEWKWENGVAVTETKWAFNKPYTKKYQCVSVNANDKQWRDNDCSSQLDNFMCTTNVPVTTTTTTSTTTTTTPRTTTTTTTTTPRTTTTTTTPATTTTPRTGTTSTTTTSTTSTPPIQTGSATKKAVSSTTPTSRPTTTTTKNTNKASTTGSTSNTTTTPTASTARNPTDPNNNGGGAQSAGSTTVGNSSLTVIEIIMIVLCITLIIIIIIMIVIVVYYKRKNNRLNRVAGYDGRPVAPIPYSGSIGDEVYIPANDYSSSSGSETNLIKQSRPVPRHQASPRPNYSITIDEKY
ncbi:hypothetical protein LSH36_399g00001 [Paralvinella palmiformis]|uniref:Uncharacterized protein n=1 Tax=Paralvinella palmiformis TaxID=53620 RepID=A0AAD9N0I8_9ANNE|nr:hypothetical protein LSH36_399g00001 [Paralvinella palmiformis]